MTLSDRPSAAFSSVHPLKRRQEFDPRWHANRGIQQSWDTNGKANWLTDGRYEPQVEENAVFYRIAECLELGLLV